MTIKEVTNIIEILAPLPYAEEFDNVGLLVGKYQTEVTGILVAHDTLESVIDEAISENCNLIVSFHPIVFKGIKKFNGTDYVQRVVMKAIKNDIAIYAIHTALDNCIEGVNAAMCNALGLDHRQILIPQKNTIKKLITYVPVSKAAELRKALFDSGAGAIGNYDECSFNIQGIGTFNGNEVSNPTVGEKGTTQYEDEIQLGITFHKHLESKIIKTLIDQHPYEEVAYEITTLENTNQHIGMGMTGLLNGEMDESTFLSHVKKCLPTGCIRHSALLNKPIKKVAVLGGSGSFAIINAKHSGAQAFITADLKYHDFYQAENDILLVDVGHYESEQFTKTILAEHLTKKIANFAPALAEGNIIISKQNTNPVKYF